MQITCTKKIKWQYIDLFTMIIKIIWVLSVELGYLFKDNYKTLIKIEDKDMDKCRDFDSFRED